MIWSCRLQTISNLRDRLADKRSRSCCNVQQLIWCKVSQHYMSHFWDVLLWLLVRKLSLIVINKAQGQGRLRRLRLVFVWGFRGYKTSGRCSTLVSRCRESTFESSQPIIDKTETSWRISALLYQLEGQNQNKHENLNQGREDVFDLPYLPIFVFVERIPKYVCGEIVSA